MWRLMTVCLIGFAGCGSLQRLPAQDITVPSTVKVKPGRLVKIQVQAQATMGPLKWLNVSDSLDCIPADDGKWAIVSVDPSAPTPAVYTIAVYGAKLVNAQAIATDPVFIRVSVDGPPAPPPPPVPPSPPPTPPTPVTAKNVWALVIVDNNARTPALAGLLNDGSLWKQVTDAGHRYRVFGTDEPAIASLNLEPFVKQAGSVPALILTVKGGPDAGKVLRAMPLPATSQGILDAIKGVSQ